MKILLIDHHALFRKGLHHLLRQWSDGISKILEAENFQDGLNIAGQHPSLDLVLLELRSPGSDGVICVKRFHQRFPHVPVVVVSGEENCSVMSKAISYGASGFVCKSSSGPVLLNALRLALSGGIYMPTQLLYQYGRMEAGKHGHYSSPDEYSLTKRQMNILNYLVEGLSNKEIARTTNLAEGTVKIHVAAVYQALSVNSRMEAVRVAKLLGLVGAPEVTTLPVSCGVSETGCRAE
ncbi:MAG: response regulator transcription factor [Gallionella sp.]|nr:response regulator transcription factor [Gallionella sp.]